MALGRVKSVAPSEIVANGFEAAQKVVALMRNTFSELPPIDIVNEFVREGASNGDSEAMWSAFGDGTKAAMQNGTHLLAVLWENAWVLGGGESKRVSLDLDQQGVMAICAETDFVPSLSIAEIGATLKQPG